MHQPIDGFHKRLINKDSMKHLALETKPDMNGKSIRKLSCRPFCLYHSSNNISYMNHIAVAHYNMAYGCGKCLKKVFLSGQQLKMHLKVCKGFLKDDIPSSSDQEPMPPGAQDSPHCSSKCSKVTKLNTAKESSSHHKKSHKRSAE